MTMIAALLLAANFAGAFPPEVKTVGLVMPASALSKSSFDAGVAALEKAGYRVKKAPRLSFGKAASVEDRARDFEEMWLDPEVDLVLCARGGTGAQDVVQKLDWGRLRARPTQRVLGFSNITHILNAMAKEGVGQPISGPTVSQMLDAKGDTFAWLNRAIAGAPQPPTKLKAIRAGAFSGLACGGHLGCVRRCIEAKTMPDAKGRVVFLERNHSTDAAGIREELEAVAASGYLKDAAGVIFGDVTPGGRRYGEKKGKRNLKGDELKRAHAEVEKAKAEFAAKLTCPVYEGYPYGHIAVSHALDFCRKVSVGTDGVCTWEAKETVKARGQRSDSGLTSFCLEGEYPGHLQDVWMADGAVWWAHTQFLVKTDRNGKIVRKAEVGGHHAGLEVKDGRLYTAVCAYNGEPRGKTTPACHVMVGEYDATTLERIDMHVLDINDRAGSFCFLEDGTFLVGCLRHPALKPTEVKFHHIGKDYKLIKTHVVDVGKAVDLGIEVIRRDGDDAYLFIYGGPVMKLDAKTLAVTGRYESFGGQMGFAREGDSAWIGQSKKSKANGLWTSGLLRKPLVWKTSGETPAVK